MTGELTGILILLAAMMVESLAQLFLKIGATGGSMILRPACRQITERLLPASATKPWVILGIFSYGLEILLYTFVLHFLDVSVAFPLGSLCFVGVALLSKVFLGETVSRVRWLGVGLILAGTVFVTM